MKNRDKKQNSKILINGSYSVLITVLLLAGPSGKIAAAQYGERLQYICKMQYDGAEPIAEGDGICVYVSGDQDPDYRVTAVKGLTEDAFHAYELEAIL